ncbi:MAG: hypothetical protein IKN30_02255 [Synergistaceae bacterium]|nr:hypothetical protein [Synergistaceae bacterium]
MKIKDFFLIALTALIFLSAGCGGGGSDIAIQSESLKILSSMTLEEKVGQLIVIQPDQLTLNVIDYVKNSAARGKTELDSEMLEALKNYPVGGFIFQADNIDTAEQVKAFTKALKDACKIFPFIAIDEEGGVVSRLGRGPFSADIPQVGPVKEIGDTGDTQNAFNAANIIGSYIKEYGFNFDFAPVADVISDNIPNNPINRLNRSFGSDPELVSKMSGAFLDGLHSQDVAGSLKHFPGHGATSGDTHEGYVALNKTWDELLECDLIPFIQNFEKTDCIMTAHITLLNVTSDGLPATLSKEILTDKLRNELGYDGILITDAMNMGAIREHYSSGEAALLALEAGNDILLMPYNYKAAFNAVLDAVDSGRISEERLNESVLRILALKLKLKEQQN